MADVSRKDRMTKLILFTCCFSIFMVLFLPAILSLGIRFYPFGVQPGWNQVEDVEGYTTVTQEFISPDDKITGIALSLKNPSLRNKKDITLALVDENMIPIRTSTLNGSHIQDGAYIKFLFSPVMDSNGKKYNLVFSAPQANAEEALQVGTTDSKQSWVGKLMVGGIEKEDKGVAFVTLHKPLSIWTPFLNIYSGWLGRLVQDSGFVVFYLLIIFASIGYLIYGFNKTKE